MTDPARCTTFDSALELLTESTLDGQMTPENAARLRLVVEYLTSDVMRIGEASRVLGVTQNTVKSWARLGRFPTAYRTEGGHWRLPAAEVLAFRDASERARASNTSGSLVPQEQFVGDPFADAGLS